jgi:hypothetical protein
MKPRTPLGFVIQRGSSPIDGKPFVAIMTLESSNRKTGNMSQVWILCENINPVEALVTGSDYSICGDCIHRKQDSGKRSCYVNVGQAPLSVWRTYKAGGYLDLTDTVNAAQINVGKYLKGRKIRWGAYGDPSILSETVVVYFNKLAAGHTGYTHQWRREFAQWCKGTFQASCDGLADYLDASAHGWKTFAVVPQGSTAFSGKQCPATVSNSLAQCLTCSLCDGAKSHIYVEAHGSGAKHFMGA